MKLIRTEDAVGQVLCHDITQIIKGKVKGPVFRKGHIVTREDIPLLLSVGKEHLYVLENLAITMRRVLTGSLIAFVIGYPLGMLMGFFPKTLQTLSPFINSLRQVPIMAWVPLAIVWFGIGDGPTVFLIAFSGIFTIILNTVAGVQDISRDFYNAARSMGASTLGVLKDVVLPASMPGVLTGVRLAIGLGWMSVI